MKAEMIEKRFAEMLGRASDAGLTAEGIRADRAAYESLAMEAYEYISKVVLLGRRNRSAISNSGMDFEEVLDNAVMHFLSRLDSVLVCSPEGRIPYVVRMISNKVIDIVRAHHRADGSSWEPSAGGNPDQEPMTVASALCFPGDDVLNSCADSRSIAEDLENRDLAMKVITALAEDSSHAFDTVCFMAIKILGWTPSSLDRDLMDRGYGPVKDEVLYLMSGIFSCDRSLFSGIDRSEGSGIPSYPEERISTGKLSDKVYDTKIRIRKRFAEEA